MKSNYPQTFLLWLFSFEALLFYSQVFDQISPYYPMGLDQVSYYILTYYARYNFFSKSTADFIPNLFIGVPATGWALPQEGALLALIGGGNRVAMLSVNLLHFLALQWMVFSTITAKTARPTIAWIALAIVICLPSLAQKSGGLFDYRIDFSAMCLYGIWVCAILRTDGFRNTRWSIAAALIGSLLILTRFLSLAYVGSETILVFVVLAIAAWLGRVTFIQARNALLCGLLILLFTMPVLLAARMQIFDYYGIGHFFGDEKNIRAAEILVTSLTDRLLYYPRNLMVLHLGYPFLLMLVALAIASCRAAPSIARIKFDVAFLALSIAVPLGLLTMDTAKSPVVIGIAVVPVVLLCVLISATTWSPWLSRRSVAVAFISIGLIALVLNVTERLHYLSKDDLQAVNRLNQVAANRILSSGQPIQNLFVDRVAEYFNPSTVQLTAIQQLDPRTPPPTVLSRTGGIFAMSRDQIMEAVGASDIAVLTDKTKGREAKWPFNESMSRYWPDIEKTVRSEFFELDSASIENVPYRVYARPILKVKGAEGGWITSSGITLDVDTRHLQQFPNIVLTGNAQSAKPDGDPIPRAVGNKGSNIPVNLSFSGGRYTIAVDASHLTTGETSITITFDRFFVPKLKGMNDDPRELVILSPDVSMMTAGSIPSENE